jgi:predicted NBD/HSP70 family sugar kinase
MRQGNLALVLDAVVRQPPISQPELVEVTGLKKPTVSKLLDELMRLGWVRPSGAAPGLVGRPRVLFGPDPDRGVVLAARISVDSISLLVVDFGGAERGRRSRSMDVPATAQDEVAAALAELADALLSEVGVAAGSVLGAALALSGIVDGGRLGYAPGLQWPDRDATALLRSALGPWSADTAALFVGNEARLAAVGEQRYGAAAGVADFVYLLGETGVGAGVVAGGRLFRGTRGAAGEVGHVSIAMDGRRCSCGKVGCWAAYVGQGELVRLVEQARDEGRASALWRSDGRAADALTPAAVLGAARAGDAVAVEALGLLRRYLAAGIGNLVSVYDPELVVLGGFLAAAFGHDLAALRAEVDDWVMGGGVHTELRLEASRIEGAPLWGGISLVHDHLVEAPRPS